MKSTKIISNVTYVPRVPGTGMIQRNSISVAKEKGKREGEKVLTRIISILKFYS